MPNYVKNKLTFYPSEDADEYDNIIKTICQYDDDHHIPFLDCNKIIPMPESLNIEAGSFTDVSFVLYIAYLIAKNDFKMNDLEKIKVSKGSIMKMFSFDANKLRLVDEKEKPEAFKEYVLEIFTWLYSCRYIDDVLISIRVQFDEYKERGKQCYDNIINYGYSTWYDWCIDKWGCKWNACSSEIKDHEMVFETAWSAPIPIFLSLSKMFPNTKFDVVYADEDMGSNTGRLTFFHGEMVEEDRSDNLSQQAFQNFIDTWGESDCLSMDEKENYHRKNCDECGMC